MTNSDFAKKLLSYFNKFRFQAFRGQIRFDGDTLTSGTEHENIFKIIKNINQIQDYAISDIIISNFSTIKQIEIIKKLKKILQYIKYLYYSFIRDRARYKLCN